MCVGKTPNETLEIILEALPTALDCALVYLEVPGQPPRATGHFHGAPLSEAQLADIRAVTSADPDDLDARLFLDGGVLWCLEAEIPMGAERGRLLAGRPTAFDPETDRVLVRTAANLVGTVLATAQVLEVARRKDDFLAMLGHELRNPLAPIMTAVDLLGRNPTVTRERKVIERHTRHLVRLVDDLLDISRVTRGHIELRNESLLLSEVLERAIEIASPLVARHHHQLRVTGSADVSLRGDPVRLAQVFGNLLTNAAKFTPPGGHIEVQVERSTGSVRVIVRDDGRGITRDQLERIFEPFVQADHEGDALRGGLGLGLAIVSSLVERHGGTISVHSEGRGRGAAFTIDLPVIALVEPVKPVVRPQPTEARAAVRILVVDDNSDIAELLSEALQDVGFQTAIAYDGQGALAQWRSFLPHAGVLDLGLPDVNGYELAKVLRTEHGDSATLIAATGYGQPTDRLRATDAGFNCLLVKPVSVDELVAVLDERVVSRTSRETAPTGF